MLDVLKKAFGDKPKEELEQVAPAQEGLTDLTALDTNAQLTHALDEIVAKDAILSELNAQITTMANEIEGYKQKLESLQHFADEAEAKALDAAEEMKAKELADKKQMLADVIGGDNPGFDVTFAAIANLEGEAFNVVVNGFKAAFEKEAESPFFKEMGVSGEAEPVEDKEESATARIIKQQYNK